jgi:hypothetical protein
LLSRQSTFFGRLSKFISEVFLRKLQDYIARWMPRKDAEGFMAAACCHGGAVAASRPGAPKR